MKNMPYLAIDAPPEIADIDRVLLQETRLAALNPPDYGHYVLGRCPTLTWERLDQDRITLHVVFHWPVKQAFAVHIPVNDERYRWVLEDWVRWWMYVMICHRGHPENPASIVLWSEAACIPDEVAEWLGVQPGWKQ